MENNENVVDKTNGTLVTLMQASASTIKKERANQVLNQVHGVFKQKIDAIWNNINKLEIEKGDLIQKLLPKTTIDTSFEVNAVSFVDKDVELVKEIANNKIWFEAMINEYKELFGKEYIKPESFF